MNITPVGATSSRRMSPNYFTGTVWQDPIIEAPAPARIRAALVTFEPGARTAWHTHPLGQTLHVTRGSGRVQNWGGPVREIRAGDTVWFPPGEKHWHGTARARHRRWPTSPCRRRSTAPMWRGWSTSPTSNTRARAGDGERRHHGRRIIASLQP